MKSRQSGLVRTACLFGTAVVCVLFALVACSNGAEGDRCEYDNLNDDCQDGLICIPASPRPGAPYTVNQQYANSDRCCPADQHQATHPACLPSTGTGGDSSAPDATTPEGGSDSGGDAPSDAPVDSPNDAADAADAPDGD
ncbi:MAG TPA: hypothetical protein VIF62_24680 [Labilithrix sp.]